MSAPTRYEASAQTAFNAIKADTQGNFALTLAAITGSAAVATMIYRWVTDAPASAIFVPMFIFFTATLTLALYGAVRLTLRPMNVAQATQLLRETFVDEAVNARTVTRPGASEATGTHQAPADSNSGPG